MIDINPQAKKLILSIDGGGMRGMIAVAMLAELETLTGKSCSQLFDMVAGTSTGAIIAAGIGLGYTAQELLEEVYRTRLPEVLPRPTEWYSAGAPLPVHRPAKPVRPETVCRHHGVAGAGQNRRRFHQTDCVYDHPRHPHRQHLLHRQRWPRCAHVRGLACHRCGSRQRSRADLLPSGVGQSARRRRRCLQQPLSGRHHRGDGIHRRVGRVCRWQRHSLFSRNRIC